MSFSIEQKENMKNFIKIFLEHRSENVMVLDISYERFNSLFVGLWRYYRMTNFPKSEAVKSFTQEEKDQANDVLKLTDFVSTYKRFEPIFNNITSGKGNEGVGLFAKTREGTEGTIIIRSGDDQYNIFEFVLGIDMFGDDMKGRIMFRCSGFSGFSN